MSKTSTGIVGWINTSGVVDHLARLQCRADFNHFWGFQQRGAIRVAGRRPLK